MFHHGVLNRKINYLHERSIRLLYRDSISLFQKLLQKDHSFTIHHRIIKSLAIELYKINEDFSYKKQKTYCSRSYKKERKNSVSNFNQEFVFDNKLFRKTVKPLFSNKGSYNFNIKLTDKDEIIRNEWLFRKCCFQFQIK